MKRLTTVIISLAMFYSFAMTALANSGPRQWNGSSATGIVLTGDNCPLVVEKEVLDFEIADFPKEYYSERNKDELDKYTDRFTACYTFFNPTDYDITATLAFPLGTLPDYLSAMPDFDDNNRFNVTLNGTNAKKEIRFTAVDSANSFDFSSEIPKLTDGYMKDDFYHPDMTVTEYTLTPQIKETVANHPVEMSFVWDSEQYPDTKIKLGSGFSGYGSSDGGRTLAINGKKPIGESFTLFAIGQPVETLPEFSLVSKGVPLEGHVEITTRQTTLKDYLLEMVQFQDIFQNMSDSDIYNILLTSGIRYASYGSLIDFFWQSNEIMAWFVYDITVPAGGRVENTVTAPLWPDIIMKTTPYQYEYTYLLSPARQWVEFREIEININTPFYMLNSSLQGMEKTEKGFEYTAGGLPQGEMTFTLCADENPSSEVNTVYMWFFLIPVLAIAGPVAALIILLKRMNK
ncbi:MAG: hypothetical protein IKK99_06705 [Oscillospiraceae bacterium]|nr:hypothetical protein [Oscillospiraceae bacterium]